MSQSIKKQVDEQTAKKPNAKRHPSQTQNQPEIRNKTLFTTMASKSSSSRTGKPTQSMMSLPHDQDSSVDVTNTKSGNGVLSRTSLYTPLSSYTSQRANKDNKKQNIAKNVQESSLTEFIATTVSSAYHLSSESRNKSNNSDNGSNSNQKVDDGSGSVTVLSAKHARNTGNRPLHVGEINSRIRQRALTLVGGGYNASVVVNDGAGAGSNRAATTATTNQAMNAHDKRSAVTVASRTSAARHQRQQRKRRKKTASTEQKPATVISNDGGGPIPATAEASASASASAISTIRTTTDTDSDNSDNINVDMLRQLHTMWLDYLCNLLGVQSPTSGTSRNDKGNNSNNNRKTKKGAAGTTPQPPLELVRSKLPKLLLQTTAAAAAAAGTPAAMELVGAKVRVQASTRHPAWVGRTGIIVQATAETYQISGPSPVVAEVPATSKDAADTTAATQTQTKSPAKIQTWIIPKRGSRLELLLPVDLANKHGTTVDPFSSSSSSDHPQLCILLDSNQHQSAKINKQ
jgi:hypothetical protein